MADASTTAPAANRDIHRIGGASVENLRLKPREATLAVPGISVLRAASPAEAAGQMRAALPRARALHQAARKIGATTADLIRSAGFDIIPVPSAALPNRYRIIHSEGVAGFTDENLTRLAAIFEDTMENGS